MGCESAGAVAVWGRCQAGVDARWLVTREWADRPGAVSLVGAVRAGGSVPAWPAAVLIRSLSTCGV